MLNDPFFAAQHKHKQGAPWGVNRGYVEDVYRTYGKLPARDTNTFERAMQFREREKQQWAKVRSDRDSLADLLEQNSKELTMSTNALEKLTREYSNLKLEYERAIDGRNRDRDVRTLPDAEAADRAESGQHADGDRVRVEVLPAPLPDPAGQASEHDSKERQPRGVDSAVSVPVDAEPVQEGGE